MSGSNVLESQRTPLTDECQLRFDDYLVSRFPKTPAWLYRFSPHPVDDIYAQLYSIRYGINKRRLEAKLEALYK